MIMAHKYEKFVVIKILSQRNDDLEQYVCIPSTWIKVKDCDNDDVVFGYPSEQRDNIARLINQSLDKRWPTLFGEVVHDTECQEDAFRVLKNKNSGEEHKTEDQSEKSKPENKKTKATFENEKSSSKQIKRKRKQTDSGDKTQNKQAKAKRSKDDEFKLQLSKLMKMLLKGKDSDRHESPSSSSSSEESDTEESEAEESESISNEDNDIPTTSRRSARAQSSKPDGYYRHIDDSSDSDYVPGYDTNSKNKSTVKKGKSKRKVSESNRSNQSEPSDNNENDAVDISDTNLCQINDEVHNQCRNFYTEVNDSFKKTMSILDNAVNYFQQVKEEVSKVSEKKSKDDKERFKKNSESQPPFDASRYSTGDTKWTILYPEPCPGLVELMPHTGVYVSEEGLNKCKKTSKDATTLARALLEEIFKMEALFVCSFTGSVPKRGSMNNLKARPGLDVNARTTLVCYAKEYGCEENMDKADKERITNSIKNALQKYHSLSDREQDKLLEKQASSKVNFMK